MPAEQAASASHPLLEDVSDALTADPNAFETLQQIGAGSFGKVFKVSHKATGKIFALKTLDRQKFQQGKLMRYAVTERKVLSFAKHPYVVQLHYNFETETHIGLVMTYCSRGDLNKLLKTHKSTGKSFSFERVRHYAAEVLLALGYLHENKILYRDLKPANVVVDQDWHALLTDFGLSKEAAEGTMARTYVGSLAFMAPEILARKGHDHTVDIYGLGVIVYTMFEGLPPFFTKNAAELKRSIREAALVVPSYVPADASRFISETMSRKPADRPGAARTADAQDHAFFSGTDFEALMRREVEVPDITPDGELPLRPTGRRRCFDCFAMDSTGSSHR